MKDYTELPAYLQRFDVAMMPFALNDATKYISPTKTLEYMAAGRPIVSTAIRDVVREYSDTVTIVGDPATFAAAIRNFLSAKTAPNYPHHFEQHLLGRHRPNGCRALLEKSLV